MIRTIAARTNRMPIGQLNQAVGQNEAADYVNDFQLPVKEDLFLYTSTKRRMIEIQPETEAKAE